MKEEIIKNVTSENPIQRLLLVTIAFGMGLDPPCVERVIHFGVPRKMEHYHQETGRAGRNGKLPQQRCITTVMTLQLIWKGWMTV